MSSPPAVAPSPDSFVRRLTAARQGSDDALGHLLMACWQYLWLVANQNLRSELRPKVGASDLVQKTFVEAQRDFGRFHGTTEPEWLAWLRRILWHNLINEANKYDTAMREVGRELSLEQFAVARPDEQGLIAPDEPAEERLLTQEEHQLLEQALQRLREDYRQAILLRHRDRLSFEEVGRELGRSAEAARKLWSRAVEELHELLGPPYDSP
jgi:RNA polymerase sigma-70 factor (ECF subfamily)